MQKSGVIQQYRQYLPPLRDESVISLHEGSTPLIRAQRLESFLSANLQIYLKYEGLNPTGSFKDRGMTMAISKAVDEGSMAVICASTGNTAASAAAYAARAGLRCYVLVPKGNIALGKLAQSMMHGAEVLQIDGLFDKALKIVQEITKKHNITLSIPSIPIALKGRRLPPLRFAILSAELPIFTPSLSEMPETSAPTGKALASICKKARSAPCPRCWASKLLAQLPLSRTASLKTRQQLRQPLRSATPPAGRRLLQRETNQGASSRPSQMTRYCILISCWLR